jgi:hypothetical protein
MDKFNKACADNKAYRFYRFQDGTTRKTIFNALVDAYTNSNTVLKPSTNDIKLTQDRGDMFHLDGCVLPEGVNTCQIISNTENTFIKKDKDMLVIGLGVQGKFPAELQLRLDTIKDIKNSSERRKQLSALYTELCQNMGQRPETQYPKGKEQQYLDYIESFRHRGVYRIE